MVGLISGGNYVVRTQGFINITEIESKLESLSDEDLINMLKKGWNLASDLEKRPLSEKGIWGLVIAPKEYYAGMASSRILVRRHGENYVRNLLGFREPQTISEKVAYFFTGKLPTLN